MYNNNEQGREFYFHRDVVSQNITNYKNKKHYHNYFEIYYIDEGSCCYFIDNKSYQILPGDIIFVPAGVLHNTEYKNTIHTRLLINCSEWYLPESVRHLFCQNPFHFRNPELADEIKGILLAIEKEYQHPDNYSLESFRGYLYRLFITIAKSVELNIAGHNDKHYIEDAIEYMQGNYITNITLSEMANRSFVSSEHFSRVFKRETGFNFTEYLNLLRLKKAESLLRQLNTAPITKIAQSCGFNDSNYFSVQFKKIYGISPKKFQTMSKKKR
jgi:AraC-like DNA-binding protein